ncbi:beta-hexosaminidase 1-like protein, partial [Trifolium pratense]
LKLGVDESYTLKISTANESSVAGDATIEANTVFGALRGLENVLHWHIIDEQSFPLEIPTYPNLWKGSYTKWERYTVEDAYEIVNNCGRNIIVLEVLPTALQPQVQPRRPHFPTFDRNVKFVLFIFLISCKIGINVMAEIDVPGHAESWGAGYPDLWPSPSCREPLDVSKNYTFDVISGILSDMRKIFPFELFHLGGDEVNTGQYECSFLQLAEE